MIKSIEDRIKHFLWLFPIILISSGIPILIYVKEIYLNGLYYDFWTGEKVLFDMFTYYRSILILVFSLVLLILLILHAYENQYGWRISFFLIPLGIYTLLVILSVVFSRFFSVSLFGFNDRYEGGFILLAYVICCVSAFSMIRSDWDLKLLLVPLIISSTILSVIGLFQFYGADPFNTDFFRSLVFPKELDTVKESLQIEGHVMYATLFNPNYVGSYVSMLFPVSLGIYWTARKVKFNILFGIYSCLMFAMWIGSRSRAGLVGASISIVLLLFLFRSTLLVHKRKFIIIIPFIIIFLIMNNAANGSLMEKFNSLNPAYEKNAAENTTIRIQDIVFDKDHVQIISDANTLHLFWSDQELTFADHNQSTLNPVKLEKTYQFTQEPYSMYHYTIVNEKEGKLLIELVLKNTKMYFYFNDTGIYLVGKHFLVYNKIKEIPSIGFRGYEQFGSGRGYIWSRTLPLLKETLWIGNGPDTFPMYYPQDDLIGNLNTFLDTRVVVDKPHSFYIQVAHNTGIISLLVLLVLFGFYLIQSIKLYWNRYSDTMWVWAGKIITGAVLSYLITSVFNDSVIYVAPIFWALLGTGFAVNYQIKHHDQDKNAHQNDQMENKNVSVN